MNIRKFTQFATGLALCVASSWVLAKPALNGMAPHTELGKERFIAALYSNTLSKDANAILNSTEARRMELKVTARFLSARSLNSMWIEGMAINNSSTELEAHAENLAKLTNMVRKRLLQGDVLAIDYAPSIGTTVSVNDVELGTIASPEFFPLLLRSWIGRVPLSSDFRKQLLAEGDVGASIAGRYASIEPDPARIEVVSGWANSKPPAPPAALDADSEEASSTPQLAIAPPPPPVKLSPPPGNVDTAPAPTRQPSRSQAQSTVEAIKKQDPQKVAASLPKNKPAPAQPKATEQPKPPAEPKPEPVVVAKAATPAPAVEDEEDDDFEEEIFSATSLLDRQFYVSSSLFSIQKNVKYPRRALERQQQGTVRLAITVDRNGAVQQIVTVEESKHRALDRAAVDAVEDASPFATVPNGVGGDSFTFTAPITFALK